MIDAVKDFGCSTSIDNSVPLQAAIDAASQGQNPQKVYLAGASIPYRTWKPIRIYKGITLQGDGPQATVLQSGLGQNPVLVVAPPTSQIGAPPIGSDDIGPFYPFDGTNTYAYDLGMDHGIDVNGLSQFCVEAHIRCTPNVPGGPNIIVSSSGRRASSEAINSAFAIGTQGITGGGGILIAWLTVNGQKYSLNSGSVVLAVGQIYHVALAYDGTTIRLFVGIPGQQSFLVASTVVSGTVTQQYTEDVIFGPSSQDWPYCTLLNACFVGHVYSLRISNVARWTAPFITPNSPLSMLDGNSLLCLNPGYSTFDMFIQATDHSYLPVRWLNKSLVAGVGNVQIRDMGIGGASGLLMMYAQNCILDNVDIGNSGRYNLHGWNNCFNNAVNSSRIGGARLGFVGSIASGPWNFSGKSFMLGGKCPFVLANGSISADELNMVPTSETQDVMVMKSCGGNSTLKATLQIDAETGDGTILLDSLLNFLLLGGAIDALSKVPLTINGGNGGIISGADFEGSAANMLKIMNAPVNPIVLQGCSKPNAAAWADNMAAVKIT